MSKSVTQETSSGALETVRRIFLQQIGVTLPGTKEAISGQLADGVHLCNLMNALRPKSISAIQTATEHSVSVVPLRWKDNFSHCLR